MKGLSTFETTFTEDLYQVPPKVTITLNCTWKDMSDKERELLAKILGAVKLSLDAVKIISVEALQLSDRIEKPKKLISFGPTAQGLAKYDLITTPETQMVLADSLHTLIKDDGLKKKLWVSLRQLFSI